MYLICEENVVATTHSEELGTMPPAMDVHLSGANDGEASLALAGLYIVLIVLFIDLSAFWDEPLWMGWTQVSMRTRILEKESLS